MRISDWSSDVCSSDLAKGINWEAKREIEMLGDLNGRVPAGPTAGRPKIDSDIDACEMILMLAPETNGEVAVKAWEALGKMTGSDHVQLAEGKAEAKISLRDVGAQPRKNTIGRASGWERGCK